MGCNWWVVRIILTKETTEGSALRPCRLGEEFIWLLATGFRSGNEFFNIGYIAAPRYAFHHAVSRVFLSFFSQCTPSGKYTRGSGALLSGWMNACRHTKSLIQS